MKSVIQKNKECFVCGNPTVHDHHILYGTANRKKSEKLGLKVWLCPYHHNMSDEGVHFNKQLDQRLKEIAQRYYEENIGSRDSFIQDFGRNYL